MFLKISTKVCCKTLLITTSNKYFNSQEKLYIQYKIINKELNKPEESYKLIRNIHSEISFKLNSFNICIGKQSTGKTTSVIKELIKLSLLELPEFHLIIYVNNNDSDITFNKLKDYVKIPRVKL